MTQTIKVGSFYKNCIRNTFVKVEALYLTDGRSWNQTLLGVIPTIVEYSNLISLLNMTHETTKSGIAWFKAIHSEISYDDMCVKLGWNQPLRETIFDKLERILRE